MAPNFPARLWRLTARQHGNVTHQQLLDLGLGRDAIKYRVRTGDFHREHLGVYSVGRPAQTWLERAAAAVLACGPDAALSHLSALALWELTKRRPTLFDVSVAGDRRPKGIRVHRPARLARRDLRTHQGIRVTSPARTLLDGAPLLSPRALTRAVNDAQVNRLLKREHLEDVVVRNRRHPGAELLKAFVLDEPGVTRSDLEDLFRSFCERFGLPKPHFNARVGGYEVDALFKEHNVIVELDSWTFHRSRESFEKDRNRDADTLAAGLPTVRVTWERLTGDPEGEAARLHAILASRG